MNRSITLIAAWALALCPLLAGAETLTCGQTASNPSRIAVAGGSLTEILYAIEAAPQIIAVDATSNYPESAKALPQIGYVRDLSAEGLLSLEPTLILAEHDAGPPEVIAQLESVGVDILRVPEAFSLEGIEAKVHCVASAVGRISEGEELIDSLKQLPQGQSQARGIVTIGVNGGSPLVAGRNTSGDGLLRMAGVNNVVNHEGWKPLSREAMIELAPDFIVISERGVNMAGGLEKLMAHPSVRLTPAADHNRVIVMDGMAMLGFGPRTVAAARELRDSLATIGERSTGS
jgi:iron complex transport system substrate-binding protein